VNEPLNAVAEILVAGDLDQLGHDLLQRLHADMLRSTLAISRAAASDNAISFSYAAGYGGSLINGGGSRLGIGIGPVAR